jgi:outer membrane protein assembly factor BamE (lipoprotein component of BamABCDE complex)
MTAMTRAALAAICLAALSACSQARMNAYNACVERGVAYFREAGMAVLSDGKTAQQGAEERCDRTVGAFGPGQP